MPERSCRVLAHHPAVGDGKQEHAVYAALGERLGDLSVRVVPSGRQDGESVFSQHRVLRRLLCNAGLHTGGERRRRSDVSGDVLYGRRG
jgi:hypothetical protein